MASRATANDADFGFELFLGSHCDSAQQTCKEFRLQFEMKILVV
jgi:hypothetical protein